MVNKSVSMTSIRLAGSCKKLARGLVLTAFILLTTSIAAHAFTIVRVGEGARKRPPFPDPFHIISFFSVDSESSIATFFQTSLLLLVSVALIGIAGVRRAKGTGQARSWLILAVIFLLLSLDESAILHEKAIEPVRDLLGTGGFLYFAWVIPGFALVVAFLIVYMPLFLRLAPVIRSPLLTGLACYLAGAVGVELIGGWWFAAHGHDAVYQLVITSAEELLEMMGQIALFYSFLLLLLSEVSSIELGVAKSAESSTAVVNVNKVDSVDEGRTKSAQDAGRGRSSI